MPDYQYSPAITIRDFEGTELTNGNVIQDKKRAEKFVKNVRDALKGLGKLTTGARLLHEINSSGKTVDIMLAGPGKDGCAMTKPNGDFAAQFASQIKSFRPGVQNLEFGQRDRSANLGRGLTLNDPSKAEEFYEKKYTTHLGGQQTPKNTSPELMAIIDRMKAKYSAPLRMMSLLTGKSEIELFRMANGVVRVDDSTYYKICIYFYEFLTPGTGCNTIVRVQLDIGLADTAGGKNYKKNVDAVDPRIMLGHELIHAWRMMKGRRIVRTGWEEEAMTTGIAFASGWEMTENSLRLEAGHPRRTKYTGKTDVSSHYADLWKASAQ